MRGLAGATALLADSADPMDDRRLDWSQLETEMKFVGHGFQNLLLAFPPGRPVSVPYALLGETRACDARSCAVQPLRLVKLFILDICDRQVGHVQIVDAPRGAVLGFSPPLALAEKHQLESEPPAAAVAQVAGVIPPLRAEIRMLEMVARKRIAIARRRLAVRLDAGSKQAPQQQDAP